MPNIEAAKKAMRVSARKRARNDQWRSRIENLQRKLRKALTVKDTASAQSLLHDLQTTLDRAARRRVVHKNAAARTKSRLAAAVQRIGTN